MSTPIAYFVVGMTHRVVSTEERKAQECGPGGCDRGFIPANPSWKSPTGYELWRTSNPAAIDSLSACATVAFQDVKAARDWLSSPDGGAFAQRFESTIIVGTTARR